MNPEEFVDFLLSHTPDPSKGLPDGIFHYATCITPMVNVDLLIQDSNGRTLLSWRDDSYCGTGWHIPGGIIRFQESIETRLREMCLAEIGTEVSITPDPVAINELIHPENKIRSHFISILYKGTLPDSFVPSNEGKTRLTVGYLSWHDSCPDNLIKFHDIYRQYIG